MPEALRTKKAENKSIVVRGHSQQITNDGVFAVIPATKEV
jgi:hypothetical protein